MRSPASGLWPLAAALALAVPASAQENYRRFTEPPTDVNRNNRIVYAPVLWAFPGPRPADQPYDVAAASWYQVPLGAAGLRPDRVLETNVEYRLERFEATGAPGGPRLRVVVVRRGLPVGDVPELQVSHVRTRLVARARPATVERLNGSEVRYTFVVPPPQLDFGARPAAAREERYELRFMPARDIELPKYIVGAPTFGGLAPEARVGPPPQLPYAERVAGRRIEYRSPRSAGRVVETRVAGQREERRR